MLTRSLESISYMVKSVGHSQTMGYTYTLEQLNRLMIQGLGFSFVVRDIHGNPRFCVCRDNIRLGHMGEKRNTERVTSADLGIIRSKSSLGVLGYTYLGFHLT